MTTQAPDPQKLEAYVATVEAAIADLRRYLDQREQESPQQASPADGNQDLIEVGMAASRFGIAKDTIRFWCRQDDGVIGTRRGGRWLVSVSALRAKLSKA